MFVELMPLLADRAVMITASRIDDATIRVNVVPKQLKDGENAALTTPLCITGTPAELDAGLPEVLAGFVTGHGSLRTALQEAADAMAAAAKEAKDAAAKKTEARKTAARPASASSTPAPVTPVSREKAPGATSTPAAATRPTRATSAPSKSAKPSIVPPSKPAAKRAAKSSATAVPTTVRRDTTSGRKAAAKRKATKAGKTRAGTPATVQAELPIGAPSATATTTATPTTTVSGAGALVSAADVKTFTTTLDRLHREGGLTKEAIAAKLGFQHASSLYKSLRRKRVTRKVYDAMQSLAAVTFASAANATGGQS